MTQRYFNLKHLLLKVFIPVISLLTYCGVPLIAQNVTSVWDYNVVGGKMLVKLYINGEPRNFIFDTGGRTALSSEFCEYAAMPDTDSLRVTDVNSAEAYYPIVTIEQLASPDKIVGFTEVPALRLPTPNPFICFEADGLIGSDLLTQFIVTIDPIAQTVTLATPGNEPTLSLRKMHNFSGNSAMPIIPLHIGSGASINVLFDTGFGGFISLKNSDFKLLNEKEVINIVDKGISKGSIGVGGMADTDNLYLVEFPSITLSGTRITGAQAETGTPPYTLLGMKILEYGSVTIDYPKRRFYFNSEEKSYQRNESHSPFSLWVDKGHLTVSSVWSEMNGKIAIGDRVTHINGKPTGLYDFCESIISGIPELKIPDRVTVTIESANGPIELLYKEKD